MRSLNRFQGNVHETGITLPASGETGNIFNSRIRSHNIHNGDEFALHGLKGNILVGLNCPDKSTGILLREKALGNNLYKGKH